MGEEANEKEGRGRGGGGNGSAVHKRGGSLLDVLKDEGGRACVRVPRVVGPNEMLNSPLDKNASPRK